VNGLSYEAFAELADRLWEEVPERFKNGLQGFHVLERVKADPDEPGLVRLGEYHDPGFPSVLGGHPGLGRHIALYYGSFVRIAAAGFDWEGEIWETIVHELQHHLESLAWRDDLVQWDVEQLRKLRGIQGKG
jgi:hypothetical protein